MSTKLQTLASINSLKVRVAAVTTARATALTTYSSEMVSNAANLASLASEHAQDLSDVAAALATVSVS